MRRQMFSTLRHLALRFCTERPHRCQCVAQGSREAKPPTIRRNVMHPRHHGPGRPRQQGWIACTIDVPAVAETELDIRV